VLPPGGASYQIKGALRPIQADVSFLEDAALKKNKGEDSIEDPVYKDTNADGDTDDDGERDEPVCYVMSTRPKLTVKFKIDPPLEEASDVWIKGEGMGNDVDFSADEVSMSGSWHTISNLLADEGEAVAPCVKIDPLTISWTYSFSGQGGTYHSAGYSSASAKLYLVLATPIGDMASPWTELLDFSCEWAAAKDEEGPVFTAIWEKIETRSATGFKYWGSENTPGGETDELLENKDGRCRGWACFFEDLNAVHGIEVRYWSVKPIDPCGGLVVKNKEFGPEHDDWDEPFVYSYFELVEQPGIPGQGMDTPAKKAFLSHGVNLYQGKIYDPCYGLGPFDDLHAWEEAAVFAYAEKLHEERLKPNDSQETEVELVEAQR